MSPEDEEFLTELHQSLEKKALGPDDERYVPLHELPGDVLGPDAVRLLGRTLTRTTEGSSFFLTGLQGAGKSVQLLRLKAELEQQGFAVVRIDGEDYLNLREPLDVTEFLFFLVGAISDAAEKEGIGRPHGPVGRGWSRLWDWMRGLPGRVAITPGVEAEAALPTPFLTSKATLKAELRKDPSFVAQLRSFLDGRLSELVAEANRIIGDLVDEARENWLDPVHDWKGLVVLVDSLDHNRSVEAEQFTKIRHALVNLLDRQREAITLTRCRTVFTLPMYVQVDGRVGRRVVNIRVTEPDGSPYQPGIDAMTELLRRRMPGGDLLRLLPDEKAVRRLVLASGGHLRDLLILATEVETQAESLPVDEHTLISAIEQVRNGLLPIAEDEKAILRRVRDEHDIPLLSQDQWPVMAPLFDRHLVLGYQNGRPWFGVHPLIAGEL